MSLIIKMCLIKNPAQDTQEINMPVDRKFMGPNSGRPIRPRFAMPIPKKKPTGGMASPGPKKKRKLTPKKPNIRKVTGATPTYKPNMAQVAGKKKAKGGMASPGSGRSTKKRNSLTKKNNSAIAVNKKKTGSMYA